MSELSLVGTGRERKRKKKSGLRRKLKVSTLDIQILKFSAQDKFDNVLKLY